MNNHNSRLAQVLWPGGAESMQTLYSLLPTSTSSSC